MSDEKIIEYDHGSSLSFVNSLETMCGLMVGFVFTGTIMVLSTSGEPFTLLSQVVLLIMSAAMGMFYLALWELHSMNVLTCLHSPKLIIPAYPARWRVVNTVLGLGSFLELLSVNLLFWLKGLTGLFVVSMCFAVSGFIWGFYRLRPVIEKSKQRTEKYLAKRK